MINQLVKRIHLMRQLNLFKFIYYNYFCKSVIRKRGCWLIPYKNSVINIDKEAKLFLRGNILINGHRQQGSKVESYLLLRKNATMYVNGEVYLYYDTTIQVHEGAVLEIGKSRINSGSVLIAAKKIVIKDGFRTGRSVYIYDSDHHPIYDENGEVLNKAKEVIINKNVWLGLKSTVLKGVEIKEGSVIGAHCLIAKDVPEKVIMGAPRAKVVLENITYFGLDS